MEVEKEELRRQLYSSLRSTGVLDSMKGQLRARLLEHLRQQNGGMEPASNKKPSLTERLLSSLFLEYLEAHGFTFTISVFMPESQLASWPPFSYHEMLELLHLDPCIRRKLQKGGEGRATSLAYQLVTVLQQSSCIQEVSTQTSTSSPMELPEVVSMKGVEDPCIVGRKDSAQSRLLSYRSLEDKITTLHQEFDTRVNAEVALQVSRLREFEINAARMDEAARYHRQLARDREELEDSYKARIERIKAREESLLERMLFKEKAIKAFAFEQRQKILTEITALRERESKLKQFKESQEHRDEKLDERVLSLRAKEEEVVRVRQTLYAQADDIATLRRKELEEQYKELCDRLHHDRTLLEAEREQMKEDKSAMTLELAASRGDKELIQALQRRQSVGEDQRLSLVKTIRELEEKLKQQRVPVTIADQRLEEQFLNLQAELEQEQLQRQASEKENKTLERELQQKKVELAARRSPRGEWIAEHNLLATIHQQEAELHRKETKLQLMMSEREKLSTKHRMLLRNIDHLDTLVKKAQEGEDRAICNLEILQVQHTVDERELLETVMLLRKAQRALEAERLENRALRSHMNALVPSISVASQRDSLSQDQLGHTSSANQALRSKWKSNDWKPKRESHDLWAECASSQGASLDQSRVRNPADHFQTKFAVSKSFSSGSDYQLRDGSTANTESLLETVVNGSIEEYYTGSSWDQDKYSGYGYEDAIPSWRKTNLAEVARPDVVPNHRCEWTKGVCSSCRDPRISAWNHGERDRMRCGMGYFQGEAEKVGEKLYDSFNGLQDSETRSPNRKLDDSDTCVERNGFFSLSDDSEEKKPLQGRSTESLRTVKGATTTKRIHNAMEIEFQNRPASFVDEHEEPFSKEKPTDHDEEEQSPSRAYGLTTSATTQTNRDVASVEDSNIKKRPIISLGSETNNRTSLEMTQGVHDANESLLIVRNTPVVRRTEADNDHLEKQGAETPCNVFLAREPNENPEDSSEAEESLSQDSPGGCKCKSSLKYELKSSEKSSYHKGDHHETFDVSKNRTMNSEIDNKQRQNYTVFQSEPQIENLEEDKTRQATQKRERGTTDEESLKLTNEEAMDVTPVAPNTKQGTVGTPPPTTSTHDSDIAQDPDREVYNQQLMRGLVHTTSIATHDEQKKCMREKEEELFSSEKLALSLSQAKITQKGESRRLVHENQIPASGKMSGLPEMMFEQEIHAEGEALKNSLQDQHSAHEDQAQEAQVCELPKLDGKTTPLELNEETPVTISSIKGPAVESYEGTPRRLVDEITSNMQHASQSTHHAPEETHSSNDSGSVYKGDSFEDEEDDVDQETLPTYSKESCTNEGMSLTQSSEQTRPGSLKTEQSSLNVRERVLGEPSENWDGASEQSSYSPHGDDAEADSVESVETCMTQGATEAHEEQAIS